MSEYSKESGLHDGENKKQLESLHLTSILPFSLSLSLSLSVSDRLKNVKINAIRTLKLTNYLLTQDKLALSNKDEKKVWFDKISS